MRKLWLSISPPNLQQLGIYHGSRAMHFSLPGPLLLLQGQGTSTKQQRGPSSFLPGAHESRDVHWCAHTEPPGEALKWSQWWGGGWGCPILRPVMALQSFHYTRAQTRSLGTPSQRLLCVHTTNHSYSPLFILHLQSGGSHCLGTVTPPEDMWQWWFLVDKGQDCSKSPTGHGRTPSSSFPSKQIIWLEYH